MKKLFYLILIALFILVLYKIDDITDYTVKLINPSPEVLIGEPNLYAKNIDYEYVQKSEYFIPYSKQDIMNIFYSFLDNGYEEFTFYCPSEYPTCIDDVTDTLNNQVTITDIGNYVHPYNNFHDIHLSTSTSGEVNLKITKTYSDSQIAEIDEKIEEIFKRVFTEDMTLEDKMLVVHDYIIDNTSYDVDGSDDLTAYNLFMEGKAKCSGYADAMAIILNKLDIKNYKIGSNEHVWNAVYINDEWSHIDVTWDDPIVENASTITNTIRHKFYMIDTETLLSYDTDEHNFNQNVYLEFNK